MTENVVVPADPEWENFFQSKVQARQSLIRLLGEIPIFSLMRAHELKRLASIVHARHFKTGEMVIRSGVSQSGFYLIRSGSVRVMRERNSQMFPVATLRPPELVSEFAIIDDSPRSSSVVAAEPSELIGFFKPDLMDIIVTSPSMGCAIMLRLAEDMSRSLNTDYQKLREMGFPFPDVPDGARGLDPTTT